MLCFCKLCGIHARNIAISFICLNYKIVFIVRKVRTCCGWYLVDYVDTLMCFCRCMCMKRQLLTCHDRGSAFLWRVSNTSAVVRPLRRRRRLPQLCAIPVHWVNWQHDPHQWRTVTTPAVHSPVIMSRAVMVLASRPVVAVHQHPSSMCQHAPYDSSLCRRMQCRHCSTAGVTVLLMCHHQWHSVLV